VVSLKRENEIEMMKYLKDCNVKFSKLGFVKGKEVKIDEEVFGSISELANLYDTSIEKILA